MNDHSGTDYVAFSSRQDSQSLYTIFIIETEFTREYITLDEYKKYIQPTRRQPDPRGKCESEVEFCKRFYEAHRQIVTYAVSALIAADTDPEAIHKTLKTAFLKLWLKSNGEPFTRI